MLTSIKATSAHVEELVLRPQDHLEATLWLPGIDPITLLKGAVQGATDAIAVLEDGVTVGLLGYTVTKTACHPWMMCSSRVDSYGKVVIRSGRQFIGSLLSSYPDKLLCNYVDSHNTSALLLIKALGFVTVPAPGNGRFHFFFHPSSSP